MNAVSTASSTTAIDVSATIMYHTVVLKSVFIDDIYYLILRDLCMGKKIIYLLDCVCCNDHSDGTPYFVD